MIVNVHTDGSPARVLEVLTSLRRVLGDRGRIMLDPSSRHGTVFTGRGPIEVEALAATYELEAKAIVRAAIDQVPGAGDVLAIVDRD